MSTRHARLRTALEEFRERELIRIATQVSRAAEESELLVEEIAAAEIDEQLEEEEEDDDDEEESGDARDDARKDDCLILRRRRRRPFRFPTSSYQLPSSTCPPPIFAACRLCALFSPATSLPRRTCGERCASARLRPRRTAG